MKAAVTVQKTALRILLYGFRRAEQELPLFRTDQRDFSTPLPQGSLSSCPHGQSGPDNHSAFTESTTRTWSEAEVAQTMGGQISPDIVNLLPPIFLAPRRPLFLSLTLPVSFLCPIIHSLFFFFSLSSIGQCKWRSASGSDKSLVMRASLLTLCHSLMSWDSNIFARVFFTLRAERRQAGL